MHSDHRTKMPVWIERVRAESLAYVRERRAMSRKLVQRLFLSVAPAAEMPK